MTLDEITADTVLSWCRGKAAEDTLLAGGFDPMIRVEFTSNHAGAALTSHKAALQSVDSARAENAHSLDDLSKAAAEEVLRAAAGAVLADAPHEQVHFVEAPDI